MTRPLRSIKGCWTCRLRRKKCDETHPICSLCDSLQITCHGYGPKPDWMDGGEIERTKLESFKRIVKHTSRRRGKPTQDALQLLYNSKTKNYITQPITLSERLSGSSYAVPANRNQENKPELLQSNSSSTSYTLSTTPELDALNAPHHDNSLVSTFSSSNDIQGNDAKLLMHFLDYVFPLQYPMYKPTVLGNDRGWFLSLLLHVKPLYHAVLGLSAFHQQTVIDKENRHNTRNYSDKHHALCLRRLQSEIQSLHRLTGTPSACPKQGLGVQACIIQLIFLEMFANETDNWRLHLTAAISMSKRIHGLRDTRGLSKSSVEAKTDVQTALELGWDLPMDSTAHPLLEEQAALKFLTGVVIYLDVISCVTLGISPRLSEIHEALIGSSSEEIRLQSIIGCENWVIMLIGKLSTLGVLNMASQSNSMPIIDSDSQEFNDIKVNLESGICRDSRFIERLGCTDDYIFSTGTSIRIITYVFALAARIYLRIIANDVYDECLELRASICSIVKALRLASHTAATQNLMWPTYIAGSVAVGTERNFFRNSFPQNLSSFSTGTYHRSLEKLEEIWKTKDANSGLSNGGICFLDLKCSTLLLL